jgi:flagellar basal body-associated protein FliL
VANQGSEEPKADKGVAPAEDNTVSLDDLLAEASTGSATSKAQPDVDSLLAENDPAFAEHIASLKQQVEAQPPDFVPVVDLTKRHWRDRLGDGLVFVRSTLASAWSRVRRKQTEAQERPPKTWKESAQDAKAAALSAGQATASHLAAVGRALKLILASLRGMSWRDRAKVLLIGILLFFSGVLVQWFRQPPAFPTFQVPYIKGFDRVASQRFEFDPAKDLEEFDSPLRQPEHVVLIDQFVVNLRRVRANSNPMGYFGFYIESVNREAAIEVKDRQRQARDLMQRVVEQSTHAELESQEGKERLKRELRRVLNEEFLTTGRVRSVYFQQFLLKE